MPESINLNPICNTTVITSVSFISICTALIVFIKKFYLDINLISTILIVLSITTGLFIISAISSYLEMARASCTKEDLLSTRFLAYVVGIILFAVSSAMVIYNK
ncbi:membrane hypothetical protein [Candidatus Methanoperedens nitroreducens]|uniref:Uncharacterized protein n=1 Tax=Candidatus Methanoperedens nitratireducens TaxID=1392998 RepID=A0A284VK10_9EURY|nr:membrane hypothetical protein [Candidatus Methanoperedens nitroreducens]